MVPLGGVCGRGRGGGMPCRWLRCARGRRVVAAARAVSRGCSLLAPLLAEKDLGHLLLRAVLLGLELAPPLLLLAGLALLEVVVALALAGHGRRAARVAVLALEPGVLLLGHLELERLRAEELGHEHHLLLRGGVGVDPFEQLLGLLGLIEVGHAVVLEGVLDQPPQQRRVRAKSRAVLGAFFDRLFEVRDRFEVDLAALTSGPPPSPAASTAAAPSTVPSVSAIAPSSSPVAIPVSSPRQAAVAAAGPSWRGAAAAAIASASFLQPLRHVPSLSPCSGANAAGA
mmetsp:Transcript_38442/g.74559  ORF Transcript_38442/g.74559 Transcript_38442/m.74559 type:complete len:285 (+) Transcript_38442:686-1540(+)